MNDGITNGSSWVGDKFSEHDWWAFGYADYTSVELIDAPVLPDPELEASWRAGWLAAEANCLLRAQSKGATP
jgi:hypothetical protein